MENVIKLSSYRSKRKKVWLAKNQSRLFRFLYDYLSHHMGMNFIEAFESYQSIQRHDLQEAWDYTDLRDLLHEGMAGTFSDHLYSQLQQEWWFDKMFLSKDETLEQCLSLYIMDSLHNLSTPQGF